MDHHLKKAFFETQAKPQQEHVKQTDRSVQTSQSDSQAEMFANRLRKNLKKLTNWAKQNQVYCYRLYDADLPEYSVAIALYQGEQTWVNVQEYEPPKTIDPIKTHQRLVGAMAEVAKVLEIPAEQIFLKVRR